MNAISNERSAAGLGGRPSTACADRPLIGTTTVDPPDAQTVPSCRTLVLEVLLLILLLCASLGRFLYIAWDISQGVSVKHEFHDLY